MANQESVLHRRCSAGKYSTVCQIVEKVSVKIQKQWIKDMQDCGIDAKEVLIKMCKLSNVKLGLHDGSFTIEGCYAEIQEIKTQLEHEHEKTVVKKKRDEENKQQKENKDEVKEKFQYGSNGSIEKNNEALHMNEKSYGSKTEMQRDEEFKSAQLSNAAACEYLNGKEHQNDRQAVEKSSTNWNPGHSQLDKPSTQFLINNKIDETDKNGSGGDPDSKKFMQLVRQNEDVSVGQTILKDVDRRTIKDENSSLQNSSVRNIIDISMDSGIYNSNNTVVVTRENKSKDKKLEFESSIPRGDRNNHVLDAENMEAYECKSVSKEATVESGSGQKLAEAKCDAVITESGRLWNHSNKLNNFQETKEHTEKQKEGTEEKSNVKIRIRRLKATKSSEENDAFKLGGPFSDDLQFRDDHFKGDPREPQPTVLNQFNLNEKATGIPKIRIPVNDGIFMHLPKCWMVHKSSEVIIKACSSFGFNQEGSNHFFEFSVIKPKDKERVENAFKDIVGNIKTVTCSIPDKIEFDSFKDIVECSNKSDNTSFVWDKRSNSCRILSFKMDDLNKAKSWISALIAENTIPAQNVSDGAKNDKSRHCLDRAERKHSSTNSSNSDDNVSASASNYKTNEMQKSRPFRITSISSPSKPQESETLQFTSSREKNKIVIRVGFGNITENRSTDQVLVNNIDDKLEFIGTLAKSMLKNAGPEIKEECRKNFKPGERCEVSEVIRTSSGKLSSTVKHILHVVEPSPPRYEADDSASKTRLVQSFFNCFQYADEKLQSNSICLPPIGSSVYGIQMVTWSLFEALEWFDASTATSVKRNLNLKNIRIVDKNVKRLKEMISILRTLIVE